jgi:hypothetical protein
VASARPIPGSLHIVISYSGPAILSAVSCELSLLHADEQQTYMPGSTCCSKDIPYAALRDRWSVADEGDTDKLSRVGKHSS